MEIFLEILEQLVSGVQNLPVIVVVAMALGFGLTVFSLMRWVKQYSNFMEKFNKLPGFPYFGFPYLSVLFGNLEGFIYFLRYLPRSKAAFQLIQMISQVECFRSPGLLRFTLGWERLVLFYNHKTVEKLITSSVNLKKAKQYKFFECWLGQGLLTSDGERWRRNRKFLTPAFHFKILESFVPIMNEDIGKMIQKLERMIDENLEQMQTKGVDVRPIVTRCTLDTICSTAMGVSIHSQDEYNNKYVGSLKTVLEKIILRVLEPLYYLEWIFQLSSDGRETARSVRRIHNFVKSVIKDRKKEVEKSIQENKIDLNKLASDDVEFLSRKRYAFLDSLLLTHLQSPKEFTMKNILDEVNTFMFGGHDTTSTSMYFSLLLIANDQRVQDKLHEEIDSVFGSDQQRPITSDDCRSLKYLEMCIKESLRLYPPAVFIAREIIEEFKTGEHTIPVGCTGAIMVSILHQDPEVFPLPERFIPERFEPDQPIHKMPYAFMPFAAGPRNCIGQKFAMLEMKILLASILRSFRLSPRVTIDDLDTDSSIILRCNTPIMISFEKKNTTIDCFSNQNKIN